MLSSSKLSRFIILIPTSVKTTIDMARNLNLKLVGEVVNSVLSEAKLKESGSDIK
jgi:hypothetical protein